MTSQKGHIRPAACSQGYLRPSRLVLTGTGSRGRRNSEKSSSKNHESPGKKFSKDFFSKSVDILLFRRYNGERAVETATQQNEKNAPLA